MRLNNAHQFSTAPSSYMGKTEAAANRYDTVKTASSVFDEQKITSLADRLYSSHSDSSDAPALTKDSIQDAASPFDKFNSIDISQYLDQQKPNLDKPLNPWSGGLNQIVSLDLEVDLTDPTLTDQHIADNSDESLSNNVEYQDYEGDVFVDGVGLTDVKQGEVGNCYLMAALASIAKQNPSYIENMITDNNDGTYTVHFGGELGDVRVDDDFATRYGSAVYAKMPENELWVAIIEKAYAQSSGGGSYQGTVGGFANNAIAEITGQGGFTVGAPSSFTPESLQQALSEGRIVTSHTAPGGEGDKLHPDDARKVHSEKGIVKNHAYVVDKVWQDENGQWQVTVYNPWGSDRYSGDGNSDGFVTLTYEEFTQEFMQTEVMNETLAEQKSI